MPAACCPIQDFLRVRGSADRRTLNWLWTASGQEIHDNVRVPDEIQKDVRVPDIWVSVDGLLQVAMAATDGCDCLGRKAGTSTFLPGHTRNQQLPDVRRSAFAFGDQGAAGS